MPVRLGLQTGHAAIAAAVARVDAGAGPGKLAIYDGTRPTNPDTALTTQNKLVEWTLPDPSFAAPVDDAGRSRAVMNLPAAIPAIRTGTAAWFQITDSDGAVVFDGLVSTTGVSTADLWLNSTSVVNGVNVTITGMSFAIPRY